MYVSGAGAVAKAEMRDKGGAEPEPKINNFDSATLLYCRESGTCFGGGEGGGRSWLMLRDILDRLGLHL